MQLIDGKKLAQKIQSNLKAIIASEKIKPHLAVILIGDDFASNKYVSHKIKACEEVGIKSTLIKLKDNISKNELKTEIEKLNKNKEVNAILVQFPLPNNWSKREVANWIDSNKDADGLSDISFGKLAKNLNGVFACTAKGIMRLLNEYKVNVEGKHAVVISRSLIVGKPTSLMLTNEKATVTNVHRYTTNLKQYTQMADILISATGKPKLITKDMVKTGVVIIDVGINQDQNGKFCGDVDFDNVSQIASLITPVPGGVGPMTIAMLLENTYLLTKLQYENN